MLVLMTEAEADVMTLPVARTILPVVPMTARPVALRNVLPVAMIGRKTAAMSMVGLLQQRRKDLARIATPAAAARLALGMSAPWKVAPSVVP